MAPERPDFAATQLNYIPLGKDFVKAYSWTNDPKDLDVETYFDKEPSIGGSYNIKGLKPVIKDKFSQEYLLKDDDGNYYRWDAEFPGLAKLDATKIKTDSPLKVALEMMGGIPDDWWIPQWRNERKT